MKRTVQGLIGGWFVLGLLSVVPPAPAVGLDDFKLAKAIPADVQIAVQARDHAGRKFVNEQFARVWAEVEKQGFDRDLKRMLRSALEEEGGDTAAFDAQWQQIADLAAGVEWGNLCKQEFAFALKVAPPADIGFILLMVPPKDEVAKDFEGLTAMLDAVIKLDEQKQLTLSKEGEGAQVVQKLAVANAPVPLVLTVARQEDTLLIGFGVTLPEQTLALLQGDAKPGASLATAERFQAALKKLPPPTDGYHFIDMAKVMTQARAFAKMAVAAQGSATTSAPATSQPENPLTFLVPLVDAVDLWDYVAGVNGTDGMQTTGESITVLRDGAKDKPFGKALYGGAPLKDPLKYVPKQATGVGVTSGLDLQALYQAVLGFIKKDVTGGEQLIAQWDQTRATLPFDVEADLLAWVGSGFTTFSAPIPTPFMPGWVFILDVRDSAKAAASLDMATDALNEMLAPQNAGVEDAKLEGAEGFKRVILPPMAAMIPGLGRPMYGLKDNRLFIANGPEILKAALQTAAGEGENFAKNERFLKEGLPLPDKMTQFSFQDLSTWGEQMGQGVSAAALMMRMMQPELAKNPAGNTMLTLLTKVGAVLKKFDFYHTQCAVTTFDGSLQRCKSVTHYQEPPKPTTRPAEEPTSDAAEKPAGEKAAAPAAAPNGTDQPAEKPADKPADKPTEKPSQRKP
jgi:hypothetical protein